jgi:hypothetical protein
VRFGRPPARSVAPVLFCLGAACSITHTVRPLGQGNTAVNASLGGPLVHALGVDMPTPILTLGGAHGLRDDLEITGHADVTAAVYGNLHLESGMAYHPLVRMGGALPTVTLGGSTHLLTNFADTRVVPTLILAAAWRVHERHLVYLGSDGALVMGSPTRVVAGPLVGGEVRTGAFGIALETKWLAPYYEVTPTAPAWLSPAGRGYLSVLLGSTYYFGDTR